MKKKIENIDSINQTLKEDLAQLLSMTDSRRKTIEDLEAKNAKFKEENYHLSKNIVDLENKKKMLEIEQEKAKKGPLILDQDIKDFSLYDIIVNIDSFKEIKWKIDYKLSEQDRNFYCSKEKTQIPTQIVVGVLGRENVGKTYIMSRISGVNLPTGHNLQTKGLSIKYSTKENVITTCLDSAGIHAPVYYFDENVNQKYMKQNEKFEDLELMDKETKRLEMINDKKLTETFIEDFILNSANVILIIVGQLTQDDQTITERVRREYQFKKKIIIIHNFPFLATEEAIQDRVKKDIEMAFDVETRTIPGTDLIYYCEKQENKDNTNKEPIVHFIYAHEGSEVGAKYNNATLKFVWEKITSINDRERFEIVDYIQKFFGKSYTKYFKMNIQGEEERNSKHEVCLFEEADVIKLKENNSIELIPQNPTFTALGSMLINNLSDFDPNYELIEYEPNKLVCNLEIPNLVTNDNTPEYSIERDNQSHLLVVKGIKGESLMNEKEISTNKLKIHSGDIKWGKFDKVVQLGNLVDVIDFDKDQDDNPMISYENGIFSVKMVRSGSKNK